jgi:hypothetical protein
MVKDECEVHRTKGHEGADGKKRYRSILSLTSAMDGGGWLMVRPGLFTPGQVSRYTLYETLGEP